MRKTAKIRKRYNQVPHPTQATTWESNKNTINTTNKSQEVSPFPAGDQKTAMNRHENMISTRHKQAQMIHKRNTTLERSGILLEGSNRFHGANLTRSSDVDQDTYMFGLHERPLAYQCITSKKHINQDIKFRNHKS